MTVDRLIKLLATHDPVELIKMGRPRDEYEFEAKALVNKIPKAKTQAELSRMLYLEFLNLFGCADVIGPRDRYDRIAEDIWFSRN